jgi:hypothetical protein
MPEKITIDTSGQFHKTFFGVTYTAIGLLS